MTARNDVSNVSVNTLIRLPKKVTELRYLIQAILKLGLQIYFLLLSQVCWAAPKETQSYTTLKGGIADIQDGAIVEGSVSAGGLQPDYLIDLHAEPLQTLLARASRIGISQQSFWNKVHAVVTLIKQDFFKYGDYKNPYYRRLLKEYRDQGKDIPLNEYVVCRAGVCREHALALHFALKAAGIPNSHVYASIHRTSQTHNFAITEDHAFTVVKHQNIEWVVDAYYWGFNGFRLSDLLSKEGITENSHAAPIADRGPGFRKILAINNYPLIYNPRFSKCSRSLL